MLHVMNARLESIAREQGVFLRSEAVAAGYDDRAIAVLTRAGAWHRVRRGAFVPGPSWAALDRNQQHLVRARAVLRTSRAPALLSHTSAAIAYGAPTWDLDQSSVHLTRLDARAGRHEAGVRQHQGLLLPGDVDKHGCLPITSATRTALDITTIADVEHALVVVDGLLHAGLTTPRELDERYALMSRWPGTLTTRLVLRLADGRSESAAESRIRYLCWAEGIPKPVPQFVIRDRRGRSIARVDLAWPEHRVYLEMDGKAKYLQLLKPGQNSIDAILDEKDRESDIWEAANYRPIRVGWSDLDRPARTANRIRRILGLSPTSL